MVLSCAIICIKDCATNVSVHVDNILVAALSTKMICVEAESSANIVRVCTPYTLRGWLACAVLGDPLLIKEGQKGYQLASCHG